MKPSNFSLSHLLLAWSVTVGGTFAATWSGAGGDNKWSTTGNWDTLPVNGDPLTFAGTAKQTNSNDLLTSVGAIAFNTAGWNITGNAVTLGGNVTHGSANGTVTWGLDTTLSATRTFAVSSGKTLDMTGVISGAGGIDCGGGSFSNTGTIRLSGTSNTFDGQVNASTQRLEVTSWPTAANPVPWAMEAPKSASAQPSREQAPHSITLAPRIPAPTAICV